MASFLSSVSSGERGRGPDTRPGSWASSDSLPLSSLRRGGSTGASAGPPGFRPPAAGWRPAQPAAAVLWGQLKRSGHQIVRGTEQSQWRRDAKRSSSRQKTLRDIICS